MSISGNDIVALPGNNTIPVSVNASVTLYQVLHLQAIANSSFQTF